MSRHGARREFLGGLISGLRVVWPILSGLVGSIVTLGLIVGAVEGWSIPESIYFSFISGLTIGYGDLVPTAPVPCRDSHPLARVSVVPGRRPRSSRVHGRTRPSPR
jgi:hypothetical protein